MSEPQRPIFLCRNCNTVLLSGSRFCTACGMKHSEKQEVIDHHLAGEKPLFWPLLMYGLLLLFCIIVRVSEFDATPIKLFVVDIVFAGIVIAFCFREMDSLKSVLTVTHFNWLLLFAVIGGSVLAAIGVNWFADALEKMSGEYYRMYMFENAPFPVLLSIISTAVFPALFEELSFRGILYTQLNRLMGVTATIIVTAVAFSILHLSPLSLLWIFPIGLITGWLRAKTGTIWYGIALHFTYNSSIVLLYFWSNEYFS